jgi:hypothetical protein
LFQAPQRGGTRPGIPPERARRLESILVQGTPAVGEETAEARDDNREQIPPRQSRSLLHPEDTLIGAVIAGERNEQGGHQGKQPSPAEVSQHRAYPGESGQIGQADSGGKLQQHGQGDEQG